MGPRALPPFLAPLARPEYSAPTLTSQNAQFIHKGSLGSSHTLWWSPLSDEDPDDLLFFIPGK
jgi:hypothetical protein